MVGLDREGDGATVAGDQCDVAEVRAQDIGVGPHLVGRALGDDPAALECDDPVGDSADE
jgi:hypothetical protein